MTERENKSSNELGFKFNVPCDIKFPKNVRLLRYTYIFLIAKSKRYLVRKLTRGTCCSTLLKLIPLSSPTDQNHPTLKNITKQPCRYSARNAECLSRRVGARRGGNSGTRRDTAGRVNSGSYFSEVVLVHITNARRGQPR